MLKLYVKTGCPFCAKVEKKLQELGFEYDAKNVTEDEESRGELIRLGGKFQAPFLLDEDSPLFANRQTTGGRSKGVSMYESDDIISYLEKRSPGLQEKRDDSSEKASNTCTLE
ncbi:glutaredoxin [Candidatus Campbellbacteria bacterium CG11_big_fil_rev_8_21_14_0_20_44_21]|uniref:Glutaredoxin n=1 Tax=Candidatus Campbellbacteria bacterium CG22_combo_CG10-13_8_21_14_all_43_18 TaxID=1974530 RepID=A0A2H0DX33_9BACT|nr:MAG: glutaredoxin [Candidatus Campbellbacteria bacterium CG22_combo_CG10-13_8_21_14_all_43_18]PIR24148.1 MAG: glutaredoxin [Candidatus Campbellbacteria bacterium CG11_big_fil_rev_8_21_14_0_20_44_21]